MPTVLAAVMSEPEAPIVVREFEKPRLQDGAAILHTLYSEVCGTDVHLWKGRLAGVPYPLIPGHVAVGRLSEVSGTIIDVDGARFKEGDLVTYLDVHETCITVTTAL